MAGVSATANQVLALVPRILSVSQDLYKLAHCIGDAVKEGQEIHLYATGLQHFGQVLQLVATHLQESKDVPISLQSPVHNTATTGEAHLESLEKRLVDFKSLMTAFSEHPTKLQKFGLRVRWTFNLRKKVLLYWGDLEVQTQQLNRMMLLNI
jgi:hypothetical protein